MENDILDNSIYNDFYTSDDVFLFADQEEFTDGSEADFDNVDNLQLSVSDDSVDYSDILNSINFNLETIVSQNDIELRYIGEIKDNSYRLYYFIGGLYVAFAVVLMIKFFKTFLF